MTATTIRVQMAQRKDTAANWTAANPILLSGEIGYETDTKKFKIGNGSTNWNSLAYLPIPDGSGNLTITGNLEIGSTGSLTFEGSTADGFETTLAVINPTADRTITLPDRSGTVITSGDTGTVTSTMILDGTIVNGDVSASAAIAGTKITPDFGAQTITTTGVVSAAVGAAATPSITFTGDPNSGIYSPGADQVAISTGGSGKLFVLPDGRVGMGVASPEANLHVKGATNGTRIIVDGSASSDYTYFEARNPSGTQFQLVANGTDSVQVRGVSNHPLSFYTNNSERLRITSAGLVGVGTSSPGARLHVGTASLSGNWSGFFGDNLGSAIAPPANYGLALGYNRSGGSGEANIAYGTGTGVGFGLVFASYDGTNYTNRVTFDGAGRVGIGTTSPVELLHVAGNAQIGAATGAAAIEVGVGATGNRPAYIDFVGDTTYADYGLRVIREDTGANANSALYHRGTGALVFNAVDSGPFLFFHNNAERARIDSSGRLLVGTSSDSGGALFQVNGDRIRVGTAKTPASATDTGIAGEICWDASYVYVCTATNTWKRSALSTW